MSNQETNRQNAQFSTGPKTPEGIEASKMNAVKHGIFCRDVVVTAFESQEQFDELQQGFLEELRPIGNMEEMLVDEIVMARWRLRRAWNAEAGAIALERIKWNEALQAALQSEPALKEGEDPALAMEQSVVGIGRLRTWLISVRDRFAREGRLTPEMIQWLQDRFGGKPNALTLEVEEERLKWKEDEDGKEWSQAKLRQMNNWLNDKINGWGQRNRELIEQEKKKQWAQAQALALPESKALDRIHRYEARLQRQLQKAIKQLNELKKERLKQAEREKEKPVEKEYYEQAFERAARRKELPSLWPKSKEMLELEAEGKWADEQGGK